MICLLLKVDIEVPYYFCLICISPFRSLNMCCIEVRYYFCLTLYFSFQNLKCLLFLFSCSNVGCIYIYNCFIFLMTWPLYHYTVFFVSFYSFWLKVYFVWYKCSYSWSLLVSIHIEYVFPFLHFQFICVLKSEVSFLFAAYSWILKKKKSIHSLFLLKN